MLIRSQDKNILLNYNGGFVEVEPIYEYTIINTTPTAMETGKYKISYYCCDNKICIGTYSTEEKAIKVLDIIEAAYIEIAYVKYAKNEGFASVTFQMPQDEEVKA